MKTAVSVHNALGTKLCPETMYHHMASIVSPLLAYFGVTSDAFMISRPVQTCRLHKPSWQNQSTAPDARLLPRLHLVP